MRPIPFAPSIAPFLAASLLLAAATTAQSVVPPFNQHYTAVDLGPMPGIVDYGGIAFALGNPNVLLVSAYSSGTIEAVPLTRDAQGHIVGTGTPVTFATVGGNDGGLAYGPGNVLFFTWYSANRLGQLKPGSTTADKVVDLQPHGIATVGTCAFVPPGRAGAGRFKIATYAGSDWFDVVLAPDANGTYDIAAATMTQRLEGGPEGILYPPVTAPLLGDKVLVAEWNAGIFAYQTDGNGDPIHATRTPFLLGLSGNAGGAIDPVTGDFLFTGNGGVLLAVRAGAVPCGTITAYGAATPGAGVTPVLAGSGCPRLGDQLTLTVQGRPGAFGTFTMGSYATTFVIEGVTVLHNIDVAITHRLDAQGRLVVPFPIPGHPYFGNTHFFFQAGYLEPTGGFSATNGLDVWIR